MTTLAAPGSRATAEAPIEPILRDLYTRLLMGWDSLSLGVLGVTSAIDGEGKTSIAAGLARTLAKDAFLRQSGAREGNILLVECSPARATIGTQVEPSANPGLVEYLRMECELDEAIRPTDAFRLWMLPIGGPAPNFSVLIRTRLIGEMVQRTRERFDLVVLDMPSVLTSTDIQVLERLTDRMLLVVRAAVTPSKMVRQALNALDQEKLAGIVLNGTRSELPSWIEQRL